MSETMKDRVAKAILDRMDITDGLDSTAAASYAEAAIEAMREPLLAIVAKEEQDFLSPEYATEQPLSSISERFACKQVSKAITAALSPSREDGK